MSSRYPIITIHRRPQPATFVPHPPVPTTTAT